MLMLVYTSDTRILNYIHKLYTYAKLIDVCPHIYTCIQVGTYMQSYGNVHINAYARIHSYIKAYARIHLHNGFDKDMYLFGKMPNDVAVPDVVLADVTVSVKNLYPTMTVAFNARHGWLVEDC